MIDLVLDDEQWHGIFSEPQIWAQQCFDVVATFEAACAGDVALMLTDNEKIQALNKKFRAKDAPTNVLSFPGNDMGDAREEVMGEAGFLGDIAMAREICLSEAQEKSIAPHDHATHLLVHGMLHLIGFDHQTDDEAEIMERREAEILKSLGIADPYRQAGQADS